MNNSDSNDKHLRFFSNFKGLLALLVILHHFVLLFFPELVNGIGESTMLPRGLALKIVNSPFNIFGWGGTFAVSLFFALSGFLITYSFYSKKESVLLGEKITKRFFTLFFPILISTLFGFLMGNIVFGNKLITGEYLVSPGYYLNLKYDVFGMLREILFGTIITNAATYNPPLWTMGIEFFGSLLTYILLFSFSNNRHKGFIYFPCLVLFFNQSYIYFIIGMILAEIFINNRDFFEKKVNVFCRIILFITIIYFSGYSYLNCNNELYSVLTKIFSLDIKVDSVNLIKIIDTTLVMIFILSSKLIKKILEFKIFEFFAKYSFEIYISHWPILYVIILIFVSKINIYTNYYVSTLFGLVLFLILTYLFAYVYKKYLSKYISKYVNCLNNYLHH